MQIVKASLRCAGDPNVAYGDKVRPERWRELQTGEKGRGNGLVERQRRVARSLPPSRNSLFPVYIVSNLCRGKWNVSNAIPPAQLENIVERSISRESCPSFSHSPLPLCSRQFPGIPTVTFIVIAARVIISLREKSKIRINAGRAPQFLRRFERQVSKVPSVNIIAPRSVHSGE